MSDLTPGGGAQLRHRRVWRIGSAYLGRMTRPLRLEYPGALYHVTARGDRRGAIYLDDSDRLGWLDMLGLVCGRCNFTVYAYCQMNNHYHLLLETVEANLCRGMQQLNGAYSQYFNQRHGLVGHIFQGRYQSILVQKESYLLELARYIVLNPLRAGMVSSVDTWPWSSHPLLLGVQTAPDWFDADWLLCQFGPQRSAAIQSYQQFLSAGIGAASPFQNMRHQLLLGDAAFVDRHQLLAQPESLHDVSKAQRRALALPLSTYPARYPDRVEAMARAYLSTMFSMAEIGRTFGLSERSVGRAIREFERRAAPGQQCPKSSSCPDVGSDPGSADLTPVSRSGSC